MPVLEIITRCNGRPKLLAANQASLAALEHDDWTQTLLIDDVGRGLGWANRNMARYAPHLIGDYIWILDDDDLCVHPPLVGELKAIVQRQQPDVIMLRMDHGPLGVLPDDPRWGHAPVVGRIGVSAFVVARAVWQAHAAAFLPGTQPSDFQFIRALWDSRPRVVWHDVVASRVQRISRGRRGD